MTAPVLVACALLAVAGPAKFRRPSATVGALRSIGMRVPGWLVRAGGAAELALALLVALRGGAMPLALLAATYAGFTAFLLLALRRGGTVASCGCLGRADTPPTAAHVVVTTTLALAATVAAAGHAATVRPTLASPTDAVAVAFTALAAWLAWLVFAVAPATTTRTVRSNPPEER